MKRHLWVFLAALSGCSSIEHTLIAPEVEGPAMAGDRAVDLIVRTAPGREVTLFSDASKRPPTFSRDFTAGESRGGALLGGLGYTFKGIAFNGGLLGANSLFEGIWLGGKLQLIGRQALLLNSPLYLSAYGRVGSQSGTKDGEKNGEFGPGGFPWEVERSGSFINVGTSVGYAITPGMVPFLGYAKGEASGRATLDQKLSGDGSSPAASYSNAFDATFATWGGGIQFVGQTTRFTVSMQNTQTEVANERRVGRTLGLALEIKVGGPPVSAVSSEKETGR